MLITAAWNQGLRGGLSKHSPRGKCEIEGKQLQLYVNSSGMRQHYGKWGHHRLLFSPSPRFPSIAHLPGVWGGAGRVCSTGSSSQAR